ncbi:MULTISPECIES: hypothetical protein [unclassified Microbacterium]|uniref:hypothetical protein n=1 Tax=unclassified Microbacterium TaxID=2609290 RepID=UPI00109C1683|nr:MULTISPECIES: hypothetical protein [unclassified Microbacterium]
MFRSARIEGVELEAVPRDFDRFLMINPGGYKRSSAVRREDISRPLAHGSFGTQGYREGQVFTFEGVAKRAHSFEMEALENHVRGICADGGWSKLTIDGGTGSQWANVGLSSIDFDVLGVDPRLAEFQIQFWAPDPRLYGEQRDFAGGQPALNHGSFPATPRLLVGAGSGPYTVTGANGRIVTVSAAPNAAHEIDFATGGLFLNGIRQINAIAVYQPWDVPPGLPGVTATISGSRTLVQRVTDTFI